MEKDIKKHIKALVEICNDYELLDLILRLLKTLQ